MSLGQPGFWDVQDQLRELSAQGDPLEKLATTVDFELFRADLNAALDMRERGKGGRPAFDPVLKFRMLVLQALHGLSLAQTEYLVADRLSWMCFCRLGSGDAVPDANTLWDFREALISSGAMERLFIRLDKDITAAGYLPMAGQIVDATPVSAPRQRNTNEEKAVEIYLDQGWREGRGHLARQAGQGPAKGHRCALDGEVQQGQAGRPRQAADRHRDPHLWLQVAHLDRPRAWRDPAGQDRGRGRP